MYLENHDWQSWNWLHWQYLHLAYCGTTWKWNYLLHWGKTNYCDHWIHAQFAKPFKPIQARNKKSKKFSDGKGNSQCDFSPWTLQAQWQFINSMIDPSSNLVVTAWSDTENNYYYVSLSKDDNPKIGLLIKSSLQKSSCMSPECKQFYNVFQIWKIKESDHVK